MSRSSLCFLGSVRKNGTTVQAVRLGRLSVPIVKRLVCLKRCKTERFFPAMRVAGVIPSRWGSTRFPGKSLALICGKPLIQWVVERCRQAHRLDDLVVATDDDRIRKAVE